MRCLQHKAINISLLLQFCCVLFVLSQEKCQFDGWEDYMSTWQDRYYDEAKKLYPFGEWFCDTNATDTQKLAGFSPHISVPVYYQGVKYHSIWVGTDGAVSFNETDTASPIVYVFRSFWPNTNYPDAPDPPFLAPFYSEADFNTYDPREPSELSYRVLDRADTSLPVEQQQIVQGMLDLLSQEVRNAVVGASHFTASYGLVITWYRVTFGGASCDTEACPRNTYQVALVLAGEETHVIYNYYDIRWVGGSGKQECDRYTGLTTGTSPNCRPAHIGFNAGYGRHFTALPYSYDQQQTHHIDTKSGTNVTGRFVYRVGGDRVIRGGCTNDTALDNSKWPLEVWPGSTDMLGGRALEVSAPCFHSATRDNAVCKFGDIEREPIPLDYTTQKATCVPPSLDLVGATLLSMSTDGGNLYRYRAPLIINMVGRNPYGVQIHNSANDWLGPAELLITWSPEDLGGANVLIEIRLMGYREEGIPGEEQGIWELLERTATKQPNSGSFTFYTASVQCGERDTIQETCVLYHVGTIQVAVHREDPNPPRLLTSELVPLGWYLRSALQREHGNRWAEYMCQQWDYQEDRHGGWTDEPLLPHCPCTLQQALVDWGRFQPDVHCDLYGSIVNGCKYYKGAQHCVVSTYATPTQGSGSRCCYDFRGTLQYAGDSEHGSRTDRAHEAGLWPHSQPPHVPSLSHWVVDMVPWFYCCEWQTDMDDCYNKYLARRMTPDCKHYVPPGFGFSFGDPHYTTLDGTTFTFNGHGEFWLLRAEDVALGDRRVDVSVQVRTVQPAPQAGGEVMATFTTAVALYIGEAGAEVDDLNIVTFSVDEFWQHSHNKLQVRVGSTVLEFREHEARVQEFQDFVIINHDDSASKEATNFTLAYRLGLGVRVSFSNGLIQTSLSVPTELYELSMSMATITWGLLGTWNGNGSDDLRSRDCPSCVIPPGDNYRIHHEFGLTWLVHEEESLFTHIYRGNLDYQHYKDTNFEPVYDPDNGSPPEPNITMAARQRGQDVCGGNQFCYYDYVLTQNEDIAMATLWAQERAADIKRLGAKVLSCGQLNVWNCVKSEPFDYYVGSTVVIEGCRAGYRLEGPTTYTCAQLSQDSAGWEPLVTTYCIAEGSGLGVAAITALSVVLVLLLCLLILGIVAIVLCLHRRRTAGKPAKPAEMDSDIIDTSLNDIMPPPPKYKTAGKPRPEITQSPPLSLNSSATEYANDGTEYSPSFVRKIAASQQTAQVPAHARKVSLTESGIMAGASMQQQQQQQGSPRFKIEAQHTYLPMNQSALQSGDKTQETSPSKTTKGSKKKSKGNKSKDPDPKVQDQHQYPETMQLRYPVPEQQYNSIQLQYPQTSTLKSTMGLDAPKRKPPYQYPNQQTDAVVYGSPYRSQASNGGKGGRRAPYAYPNQR